MNEKYIQSLRDAIQKSHNCISRYSQTVAVKVEQPGKDAWEGKVEIFDLAGHASSRQCYAWAFKDECGRLQYVTVMNPPAKSAAEAVRSLLATQKTA